MLTCPQAFPSFCTSTTGAGAGAGSGSEPYIV